MGKKGPPLGGTLSRYRKYYWIMEKIDEVQSRRQMPRIWQEVFPKDLKYKWEMGKYKK